MSLKYESEDELIISKIEDKIKFTKTKNKIQFTDFYNTLEKRLVEKYLIQNKIDNYIFFGGNENSERGIYLFYPEKINEEIAKTFFNTILQIIKIKVPKEECYEHKVYLSAIMKLGIKREKIGDIIVLDDGAEIVVFEENAIYIQNGLNQLTRFKKSIIEIDSIDNLTFKEVEFENFTIIVNSIRLDSMVSELARCSRSKAEEYIEFGKVFVNSIEELKCSKKINIGDIITIRGKGKFVFDGIEKETSKQRLILNIRKYC